MQTMSFRIVFVLENNVEKTTETMMMNAVAKVWMTATLCVSSAK